MFATLVSYKFTDRLCCDIEVNSCGGGQGVRGAQQRHP